MCLPNLPTCSLTAAPVDSGPHWPRHVTSAFRRHFIPLGCRKNIRCINKQTSLVLLFLSDLFFTPPRSQQRTLLVPIVNCLHCHCNHCSYCRLLSTLTLLDPLQPLRRHPWALATGHHTHSAGEIDHQPFSTYAIPYPWVSH